MKSIRISAGGVIVTGELNDSRAAAAIAARLPITAKAETWGDEIYFRPPTPRRRPSRWAISGTGRQARRSASSSGPPR